MKYEKKLTFVFSFDIDNNGSVCITIKISEYMQDLTKYNTAI